MVVVDFYLEPNAQDPEETVTGIDVLTQLKEYDPDIEVIILSSSDDIDISASATRFGALSFIKKGEDDFKKIVNNIVWSIHEKQKLRKKAETQRMVKNLGIGMGIAFTVIGLLFAFGILDFLKRL
jgi:DNA-binding NtrC family response regulator